MSQQDTSGDFEFVEYPGSEEHSRFRRALLITCIVLALVAFLTIILTAMQLGQNEDFFDTDKRELRNAFGLAIFLEFSIAGLACMIYYYASLDRYQRRKQKAQAQFLRKKEGVLAAAGTTVTFHELWTSNNERIDFYHNIATDQSQTSFRAAQLTAIAGFVLVIGLGIFTVLFADGTAALAASVVAVAAAAMSGYVGATFLKAQAEASAQLRVFFSQPVELARLLSAERLVEQRVDKDRQSDVVAILAAAVLGAPAHESEDHKTES